MTTLKQMKFRVESPEHSAAIQMALFAMDRQWLVSGRNICHLHSKYIMTEGKDRFDASSNIDIFAEDLGIIHSLVKGQIVEGDHPWDGFIPWFGGECPIDLNCKVAVVYQGRIQPIIYACDWGWSPGITAYKVVEQAPKVDALMLPKAPQAVSVLRHQPSGELAWIDSADFLAKHMLATPKTEEPSPFPATHAIHNPHLSFGAPWSPKDQILAMEAHHG